MNVVCRAKANSCVPLWFGRLRDLLVGEPIEGGSVAAEWLIRHLADDNEGRDAVLQMLLYCPSQVSRREFIGLVVDAIKVLQTTQGPKYLKLVKGRGSSQTFASPVTRLLAYLLVLVQECTGNTPPQVVAKGDANTLLGTRTPSPAPVTTMVYILTPEMPRLLNAVAQISEQERVLLLWLNTVPRLSHFVTSLNGGENRGLMHTAAGEEALALCLRVLEVLVGMGHAGSCYLFSNHLCRSPATLEAVIDKKFMEMAIVHHPQVIIQYARGCKVMMADDTGVTPFVVDRRLL